MFEKYKYNSFLIKSYFKQLGPTGTHKFLIANEKPLSKSIRINTLKTDAKSLLKRLQDKGFVLSKIKWCNEGYMVKKEPFSIGATPEYLMGLYYVQDASSMAPIEELAPGRDETVLDMTAAPGGKTTHMAQLMENTGVIVASDMNKPRMRALRSNIQRMGVENVLSLRMHAQEILDLGIKFDKILLDAPCTGEGTIRKNPDRRKSIDRAEVKKYANIQKELLEVASKVLKPNGILLYSTCSILPEEDEDQVEYAVKKLGFKKMNLKNKFCSKDGKFYPHLNDTQGFFMAKLMKT